jgi:acetamidase/formamidase
MKMPKPHATTRLPVVFISTAACAAVFASCATAPSATPEAASPAPQRLPIAVQYKLAATPKTVAWGYYDAAATPVLHVHSGDVVEVATLITSSPARLEAAGVKPADVQQSLRNIYDSVKTHGPGGHILTGPIYVEGAEPGDVLEVRIEQIDLAIPYAYNSFGGRSGFIPEDYGYSKTKIIPLDQKTGLAHFSDSISIVMHPFFGSIGVAPPPSMGKVSSAPPGIYAGNLDNKELVAGTTLFIPVHARGALLEIGEGHAG